MRKIIFLDFDGVLHSHTDFGSFGKFPNLDRCLRQMAGIEIVVSSTWRETRPLSKLRELFPERTREMIVGVTPILDDGYDKGGRQKEIEAYLSGHGLTDQNAAWLAIDDVAEFFEEDCPYLLLIDPFEGFTEEDGTRLMAWYRKTIADKL
jgi:hypothetical protein